MSTLHGVDHPTTALQNSMVHHNVSRLWGVFTILDKPLSCFVGYIDAVSAPFPQYNHLIYHLHTHHIAILLVKY
jgi:hypothetical protein